MILQLKFAYVTNLVSDERTNERTNDVSFVGIVVSTRATRRRESTPHHLVPPRPHPRDVVVVIQRTFVGDAVAAVVAAVPDPPSLQHGR